MCSRAAVCMCPCARTQPFVCVHAFTCAPFVHTHTGLIFAHARAQPICADARSGACLPLRATDLLYAKLHLPYLVMGILQGNKLRKQNHTHPGKNHPPHIRIQGTPSQQGYQILAACSLSTITKANFDTGSPQSPGQLLLVYFLQVSAAVNQLAYLIGLL